MFNYEFSNSSTISSIMYVESELELYVTFTSGRLYCYSDVGFDTVEEFIAAECAGRYFVSNIKNEFELV